MKKSPVVHVDILGKKYRINTKPDKGYLGQVDHTRGVVSVVDSVPLEEGVDILFHEALHGLSYRLDIKLTEHKIRLLEAGVLQFLRANGVKLTPLKTLVQRSRKGHD